jgi:hypothetical protein
VNAPGANVAGWWDGGPTTEFADRLSTPERTRNAHGRPTPDAAAKLVLSRLAKALRHR